MKKRTPIQLARCRDNEPYVPLGSLITNTARQVRRYRHQGTGKTAYVVRDADGELSFKDRVLWLRSFWWSA